MKKTVVTILLVLPFVLMFLISFMAILASKYQHIYVESVCFVNSEDICTSDFIKLGLEETYDLDVRVYPELASNKRVSFFSLNENIVSIDEEGVVTAKDYGTVKVRVVTEEDGSVSAELLVKVSDDFVSEVNIVEESLEIDMKDEYTLNVVIGPYTAINKKVSWSSSDSSIATVDANGKVVGIKQGEVTITVKTEDGGFEDTCVVKVNGLNKPFDVVEYEEGNAIYVIDSDHYDLNNLVVIYDQENINIEDVKYKIVLVFPVDSMGKVSIEDNYLNIKENISVQIMVEVEGVDYKPTIFVRYEK